MEPDVRERYQRMFVVFSAALIVVGGLLYLSEALFSTNDSFNNDRAKVAEEAKQPISPSPEETATGSDDRLPQAGVFHPSTFRENGLIVMPLTFVDGSKAEATFPPDLGLADTWIHVSQGGGLGRVDREMDFLYGDGSNLMQSGPLESYEGHDGDSVEVWEGSPDIYQYPNLVYQFGDWFVAVRVGGDDLSENDKAAWAKSLVGRQTKDGFLILDAMEPLKLLPANPPTGPSLTLLENRDSPRVQFFPGECDPSKLPDDGDIRTMDDGLVVSFESGVGSADEWLAQWCQDGQMLIQVENVTSEFALAAARDLRLRNIVVAPE